MYMFNQCCCCYSEPILDVADNKFAESAAVLMVTHTYTTPRKDMIHELGVSLLDMFSPVLWL
jgi:hypothetical protein